MSDYSIDRLYSDIERVRRNGARAKVVGTTALGRDIVMLTRGDARYGRVLVQGAVHAREYIVAPLLLRMLDVYRGRAEMSVIPAVNVDGCALVLDGIESVEDRVLREWLIVVNGDSRNFSLWKANAKAVDINTNFNANWGGGTHNICHPASESFIGEYPMSERESQVLAGVTYDLDPIMTLSYHTKGDIIYEGYMGNVPHHDIAEAIADYTHYDLSESRGSHGGYKDWFVQETGRLGLTIECGRDDLSHPIGIRYLDEIYESHRGLLDMIDRDVIHRLEER